MYRLINEIIVALENKEYCTALFIDIGKAFDKINHESLLQTIRKQFPEQIHQLIKSYLSSRTFVIKINDTYSQVKDIKAGVPQGSVLGPILYTIYTANIPTTTNSTVLTFADDTAILVRHTNPETAVKILHEHIIKIENLLRRVKRSARRLLLSDRNGPSAVRETLNKPKAHYKPSLISLQES